MMDDDHELRYPIGEFDRTGIGDFRDAERRFSWINDIAELPLMLAEKVSRLDDAVLETSYRQDGWTIRQVVHHVADSHMNSLCRFKLALTEEAPTIKAYFEDRWAELADSKMPVGVSLKMLGGIHERWASLLRSMTDDDFERRMIHPETGEWRLGEVLALYSWHGRHHTAHIAAAIARSGA
jgi:uncharacterized damage-inducible protein DinB